MERERDQANELVVELLDILQAAVLDRLMIDHDAEFAAMILSGQAALPSGCPDWMAAAATQLSSFAATRIQIAANRQFGASAISEYNEKSVILFLFSPLPYNLYALISFTEWLLSAEIGPKLPVCTRPHC